MKKSIMTFVLGFVCACGITAFAQSIAGNPFPVFVDGSEKNVDAYNIDGYTYVKLRDIASLLDCDVSFDDGKIYIQKNGSVTKATAEPQIVVWQTAVPQSENYGIRGSVSRKPSDDEAMIESDEDEPSEEEYLKNLIGIENFEEFKYNMTFEDAEKYVSSKYGKLETTDNTKTLTYSIGGGRTIVLGFVLENDSYLLKTADRVTLSDGSVRAYDWDDDGYIVLHNNENAQSTHTPSGGSNVE